MLSNDYIDDYTAETNDFASVPVTFPVRFLVTLPVTSLLTSFVTLVVTSFVTEAPMKVTVKFCDRCFFN